MAAEDDDPFAHLYGGAKKTGAAAADEDNPFAHLTAPPVSGAGVVKDIVKQIPSGVVAGVEAAATFPAQAANLIGGIANRFLPSDPEAEAQQAAIRDLAKRQGGAAGVSQYLPAPETTAGRYARTAAEFVPSVVAGGRTLSVPRAAGVGATTGLVSEAAGQATEGTAAEPYARVGAGLVGGTAAARQAERAAARAAIPTRAATEAEGARGFDAFRQSGFQLSPQASPTYARVTQTELQNRGLTDITADQTHRVLQRLTAEPATTPQQLQAAYQELGAVARGAKDANERLAANVAQERLLTFMDNPPAWMVAGGDPATATAMLREANANWASAKRAENVERRIVKAELKAGATHSGLNLENQLRQRIGVLGEPDVRGGFSPRERAAFVRFAEGGPVENQLRYVGNILGGGGGLGSLLTAGGGVGLGALLGGGDPYATATGGLATFAGGRTLRALGNRLALSRARQLEQMLLSRSPFAARTALPPPQGALPLAVLPPTLATLGE